MKKLFPYYPFLFAVFPVLSLIAYNKFQTQFSAVFRPLIAVLLFSLLLYGLFFLIFKKNWPKAALITSVTLILFFSYGHIFTLIESSPVLGGLIGQHRYVVGIFGLIWIVALFLTIKINFKQDFTKLMNIIGVILIALPLIQTGWFYLNETIVRSRNKKGSKQTNSGADSSDYSPDVYYIILDTYARPDALIEDYDLDMTGFIDSVESMGFYYADESQTNYSETFTSLATSLNMQLIGELTEERGIALGDAAYRDLVIHSEVRSLFESLGYQTIAFSTGYRWSELTDADIYYQIKSTDPLSALTPFELLLVKNLIIYPFRGYLYELLPDNTITADSSGGLLTTTQTLHIETQRNVLEVLPQIADNPNATFTFAHILIPHPPLVFDSDGSILTDPGYFSGDNASALNEFYEMDGYKRQVQFISQAIEEIVQQILENSDTEPIIIVQGDHGKEGENRSKILNLYYFPDQAVSTLYPAITPVNSFRAVFDTYFGFDFPLVEDKVIPLDGPVSYQFIE